MKTMKGYLEHEVVKNLANNKDWMPQAVNKAVKGLLHSYWFTYPSTIVQNHFYGTRHLVEVIASQQKDVV